VRRDRGKDRGAGADDDGDDEGEAEPTPVAAKREKAKRKANKALLVEGHTEVVEPPLVPPPQSDRRSDDLSGRGSEQVAATPTPTPTPTLPQFPKMFEMLKKHGIESLYPRFEEQNIDYDQFMDLTEDEWQKFLDTVEKVGDFKRLQALYRERVKTHAVKAGKRELGRGRSSVVHEGFMDQQRVALKMYKDKTISSKERLVLETTKYALRQSCTVHQALLNPYLLPLVCLCHRHPNVVHCYGTDGMCTRGVLCAACKWLR
jgi:hypothetical protein